MQTTSVLPARVNPLWRHDAECRLSLDGAWQFALDPEDRGCEERWYVHPDRLRETIQVPGSWQGQGFGGDGDDLLWDFQLRTRIYRATYTGTGWYGRSFQVPDAWQGKRIWLNFGGAHPSAEIWVNGVRVGAHDLPFVPFAFDVTPFVHMERENVLVVRVHENHREFGLAFNYQGNWSGLYRGVELTATGATCLGHCRLLPDAVTGRLRMAIELDGDRPSEPLRLQVAVRSADGGASLIEQELLLPEDGLVEIPVPSPRLWSPDAPNLYRVNIALKQGEEILDALSERTGFVTLGTAGKHFLINGDPYYLRGTGDFLSCPETGCPDTDRARWRRKLQALRDYGYNYVRCQSYVYGPEYYDIADEVGLLIQSEMGMLGAWGGMSPMHVYQWPKPTPDNYPVLKRQWDLVVQRDAHHPSANLYCMSNEYGTGKSTHFHFPRIAWECYHATKALKPTAFVLWTDGGYRADLPGDFVNDEATRDAECDLPVVQHEFRWWSSYPDIRLKERYDGAVRPYAIEIAEQAAARHGLAHLLTRFADASQRLQFQEAKLKMENCRRDHPTLAGISHFDAMDANPSPQGVITEFYEQKLIDSACWLQTNGDTVLLTGLEADNRALTAGETFRCKLSVSDFAHPPFQSPRVEWVLRDKDGRQFADGLLTYSHQSFRTCEVGEIAVTLPEVTAPVALMLHARLYEAEREITNAWPLWLFPAVSPLPAGVARYGDFAASWLREWTEIPVAPALDATVPVLLTDVIDDAVESYLQGGGRVILAATEGLVRPHPPNFGYVNYYFTPPANYSPYEDGQNGTLVADHPMLGAFPHEGFADLHWFRMIDQAPPLDLEPLGLTDGEPAVRVIHRYPVCRPLGYLHEVAVGKGRLILCGLSLSPEWVEARYLLTQLCAYALNPMAPAPTVSAATLASLKTATALARVPLPNTADTGVQS
ncbi:MAG: glycoside hydrolase family 2 protein [Armatimonadota bacterium]